MQTYRLLALSLLLFSFAFAQNGNLPNRPKISVQTLTEDPVMDGNVINDAVWQGITPLPIWYKLLPIMEQR